MRRAAVYFFAVLLGLHPSIGRAAWQTNGNPVCTAASNQLRPTIASDGAGGAIVAWEDSRTSFLADIYAQRINASGVVQWTPDGVALCVAQKFQQFPACASDGAGGAIVTWEDQRVELTVQDVFAQRINASGAVQWTTDGILICGMNGFQIKPEIVQDGVGGAVLAWPDGRSSVSRHFAQRVDASGSVQWTSNGVLLNDNTEPSSSLSPNAMVQDGAGGGIVAWSDVRLGTFDIYVQRIDANGVVQWVSGGLPVCTATGDQGTPAMIRDGSGGAIMTWQDPRINAGDRRVYAQRVDAAGTSQWTTDGLRVCDIEADQLAPRLVSDGAGGAIVTWSDKRASQSATYEIYAQRFNSSGARQWTPDGVQLSNPDGPGDETNPIIVSDGAGGAFVIWMGGRLLAQHIDASGAVQWAPGGETVTNPGGTVGGQVAVPNGSGGAIVAWVDQRTGPTADIYAMELDASGVPTTGVGDPRSISAMTLSPSGPNPFSTLTMLSLDLPIATDVAVDVADLSGRIVRRMDLGYRSVGTTRMSFDGRDNDGRLLPQGMYFYNVHAGGATLTHRLAIVR
jgi:flagellar hook capping protein FlgD